jgi:hypothetical protein
MYSFFYLVMGLVWSNNPESYAGGSNDPGSYADGSVATGRVSLAGHVEGYDTYTRDTLLLLVAGWRMSLKTLPPKTNLILQKPNNGSWLEYIGERTRKCIRTGIAGKYAEGFAGDDG